MLFFASLLHPKDRENFDFTLSSANHQGPGCQFHWTVLLQGMANSPTVCQEFVAAAIEPTRCKYTEAYVLHYIDNILISHPSESTLLLILADPSSEELFNLFFQLHILVQTHLHPCFVSHLCSHSDLPGPLTDGNAQADNLLSGLALGLATRFAPLAEAA
jgi:hypothetical protein